MYATVQDLRDEGVTEAQASDARLERLLAEASSTIDAITGWSFEPREWTLRLDGSCRPSLEPPVVPIVITDLWVNGVRLEHEQYGVVGAPVVPGFVAPRIELRDGRHFPDGQGNVLASGMWGYTEPDGTPFGRTPWAIRRAAMLLVLRNLAPLSNEESLAARSAWRILSERTRDQEVRFANVSTSSTQHRSGDPEIDAILIPYVRPIRLGAV